MNTLLLAIALALVSSPLPPSRTALGSRLSASPPFSGGTLTAPLVLEASNTLCSQALSLSFNGDADLGLQRSAADILRICASGGVLFNGALTSSFGAAADNTLTVTNTTTGASASAGITVTNQNSMFLYTFNDSYTATPYLTSKTVLWGSAAVVELLLSSPFQVSLQTCNGTTPPASTCPRATLDSISGTTADWIIGSNTNVHWVTEGAVPTINGASTCTSTSINAGSTDTAGRLLGTCTAGQTFVLDFAMTWTTNAPWCFFSAADTDAATANFAQTATSTTSTTFTAVTGDADALILNYHCKESR